MIATALVRYLVGFGLVIATLGIGWFGLKTHYENAGYAKAMRAIAAQDAKAKKQAEEAANEVKACFDTGGTWDVSDDACLRGDQSARKRWWPF